MKLKINSEASLCETLLQEKSKISRLYALLTGYDYEHIYSMGIITAENPMGKPLSSEKNKRRMKELKSYLSRANFVFLQAKGKYGVWENSLIIQNVTKKFLRDIADKFEQEAFIYGELYENSNQKGMKFEYWEQRKIEKIIKDADLGKVVKTIPSGIFELVSTRFTYVKHDALINVDNYFTEFKGIRFLIPFFDDSYDENNINEERTFSLKHTIVAYIDKKELLDRIKEIRDNKNKTEKWLWEKRGVVKLMLTGQYPGSKLSEKLS